MSEVVVGAAVLRAGRLLAAQRAHPPEIAGQWELPGGRVEDGETASDALRRELREELGVDVVVGARVGSDVPVSGGRVLRVYAATLRGDSEPVALEHRAVRWLADDELDSVEWLPADVVLLPALHALLGR